MLVINADTKTVTEVQLTNNRKAMPAPKTTQAAKSSKKAAIKLDPKVDALVEAATSKFTYRELQALVKANRKSTTDCKANAKATVLVEYLKSIGALPANYVHEAASKKTTKSAAPKATKEVASKVTTKTTKPSKFIAPEVKQLNDIKARRAAFKAQA